MNAFLIAYYILSFSQTIPCVIKLIKTKKSKDYSLLNRLCQYLALLCWTVYLFYLIRVGDEQLYVGIIGIADVLLLTIENILILKYHKE